jgi:methylenetetrahydrofolate dehydrogenase (NADP+)/methenyltetrahydrofolate cyclohydrolase
MAATLLKGKPLARKIEEEVAGEVTELKQKGITPHLTVVLVGENPASRVYIGSKEKACKRVGISSETLTLPETTTQTELLKVVRSLNEDGRVHGILVQLPLPGDLDADQVLDILDPAKDVDGFTPANIGKLLLGFPYTVACTPAGILALMDHYDVPVEGSDVVILGRSNIVGKPLAALLMQKAKARNCTVTVCHSRTKDIAAYTRRADIIVAAISSPRYLKADMVREGCVVIDVGINRVKDESAKRGYRLVGDTDFEGLESIASFITPVPGGVGPLTVGMLLRNTIKTARSCGCPQ